MLRARAIFSQYFGQQPHQCLGSSRLQSELKHAGKSLPWAGSRGSQGTLRFWSGHRKKIAGTGGPYTLSQEGGRHTSHTGSFITRTLYEAPMIFVLWNVVSNNMTRSRGIQAALFSKLHRNVLVPLERVQKVDKNLVLGSTENKKSCCIFKDS